MARRFLALWLPYFETERLGGTSDPLATLNDDVASPLVGVVNQSASEHGIRRGMTAKSARALLPSLKIRTTNQLREEQLLVRLADWCGRYSPSVALDRPNGLTLETTGCDRFFGGDVALLADLVGRMAGFGFTARAAIAPTPGSAWALSRFGDQQAVVQHLEELPTRLGSLPTGALRLPTDVTSALDDASLFRIEDLIQLSRARLATRFGARLVRRLDQALGRAPNAFCPHNPPAFCRYRRDFDQPLQKTEEIKLALRQLLERLCEKLEEAGRGVRQLSLVCYRVDGHTRTANVRTCLAVRHVGRLWRRLAAELAASDFSPGVETMVVAAIRTEVMPAVAAQRQDRRTAIAETPGVADAAHALPALPSTPIMVGRSRQTPVPGHATLEALAGRQRAAAPLPTKTRASQMAEVG